jgi:hypothetical protein
MTIKYDVLYVVVWTSGILAIPASIGLLTWLIFIVAPPSEDDHTVRVVVLAISVLMLVAWTAGLRRHGIRVLVRAGAFPALCKGDRYPHDELEFRQAVLDITKEKNKIPAIVGSGWGFFLKRYGPSAPRIFTHNFKGPVAGESNRFHAGTTIYAVNKHILKTTGKTLPSHPTMDFISVGSWVSAGNHGNDGDAQTTNAIDTVTVLDMNSNVASRVGYLQARRLFDSDFEGKFAVLDVSLNSVENKLVQKRGILVKDAQSAADWLAPGAALRLLFVGAARDYGIGLRFENPYNDDTHSDPHCCSTICQFLQLDVLSVFGGWHERMDKYNGKCTLYQANRWTPAIFPIMNIGLILSGILNFEIFFRLPGALDGNTLFKFMSSAIRMHKKLGGRSEIRYGQPGANTVVHWDISLRRHQFPNAFNLLKNTLKVSTVAVHPGKCDVADTAPCQRVTISKLITTGV